VLGVAKIVEGSAVREDDLKEFEDEDRELQEMSKRTKTNPRMRYQVYFERREKQS
jgi:hypothetical protein